jgi:hypothetical protein
LKNSEAKAILALRLTKSNNKALRNYSAAVKRAPFLTVFTLKAYKAFTFKINQDKRLLVVITLKA